MITSTPQISGNETEFKTEIQELFRQHRRLLPAIDKEITNNRAVSADTFVGLSSLVSRIVYLSHRLLRPDSNLSHSEKTDLGHQLQAEMLPPILLTNTIDRFFSKPMGYAGDYYTLELIYRNIEDGKGRLGPIVDRLYLEAPTSRAVRNRRELLAREISKTITAAEGKANVMSIASGPAREVWDVFSKLLDTNQLKATLLDFDLQALAFVNEWRTNLRLDKQINIVYANIIHLITGRNSIRIPPQHLIYSVGLIDYFEDEIVIQLLNYIYTLLAPGGRVILGNFHKQNVYKEYMDYVVEWRLIHRDEQDMNRLVKQSAFNKPVDHFTFEAENINMFALIQKPF